MMYGSKFSENIHFSLRMIALTNGSLWVGIYFYEDK
jgi:hypothetical protein